MGYLLRIRELERLRRSPLPLRRDVFLKRRLSAWFKKLSNSLRRIRESRRESMLVTDLNLTYTTSRTNWRMTRRVLHKLSQEDKKDLQDTIDEVLEWMDSNP